jgi:ATP/maltotriose-dependent transcriptional regulator MalT/DNA-binding SARP family transcriptional activator
MNRLPVTRLAKLCAPRHSKWLARQRLHQLLDDTTRQGVAWIAAGPGSGKSTLAACWAAERRSTLFWYRVDPGDADLRAAFGYFAQLVRPRKSSPPLPTYQPQAADGVEAFARNFFRDFFALTPSSATLVFDDAHVAAGTDFDQLLAAAVREVPPDVSLLVTSRCEPAGPLMDDVARGVIGVIEDSQLAFINEEAAQLLVGRADRATAARWQSQVGGWAAGILLLARNRGNGRDDVGTELPGVDRIRAFFAESVIAPLAENDLRTLAAAALLPEVDGAALQHLGCGDPGPLERLRRQHNFVTRLERHSPCWRLHDLLRDALHQRFEQIGDSAWRQRTRRAAAQLALDRGLVRQAVDLWLQEGDREQALRAAEQSASSLVQSLRLHELDATAKALGDAVQASLPLQIALAESAWQRNNARLAVESYERAYGLIGSAQPCGDALIIAAGAITAILEGWQDFDGSEQWMRRLHEQLPARGAIAHSAQGLRADSACLQATNMIWGGGHREHKVVVERMLRTLRNRGTLDANTAVSASSVLMETAGYRYSDAALFREVVSATASWLADLGLAPLTKAGWLVTYAPLGRRWPTPGVRLPASDPVACLELAVEIGRAHGGRSVAFSAALFLAHMAVATNDSTAASARLVALREFVDETQPRQLINFLEVESNVHALHADWPSARRIIARARELAEQHGFPSSQMWNIEVYQQRIAIAGGDAAFAHETLLRNAERYPAGNRRDFALILADMAAAAEALHRKGNIPDKVVRAVLARARAYDWPGFAAHLASLAARMCARAIQVGIEPEFARRVVHDRRLTPPSPWEPHWPWPVRVRALGGLGIEIDGAPLPSGPRAQRKPFDLLKLLIAYGPEPVDTDVALDALWPEADGAAARASFDMTVMRLRKLLGRPDALSLEGSRIGLSTTIVWVDAFAFSAGASDDYPGSLFGAAAVQSWWAAARERLHQRFLRRTAERGRELEHDERNEEALAVYEAALVHDGLAEELYQGAIRCHLAAGRSADALRVLRRCREQLSIVLGVKPSEATLVLVAGLSRSGSQALPDFVERLERR